MFLTINAQTLMIRRERFRTAGAEIKRNAVDDNFKRMWEDHLCYCEAGFRNGAIDVVSNSLNRQFRWRSRCEANTHQFVNLAAC
jgi:hypothetical protein